MILTMNKHPLELNGKYLGMLREANDLLSDSEALNARLEEDGYLLIRTLHNRKKVETARRFLLEKLDENGQLDTSCPLLQGVPAVGKRGTFLGGNKAVTHDSAFLDVVESPEIMSFCEGYFDAPVITYDYKWLRVIQLGGYSGGALRHRLYGARHQARSHLLDAAWRCPPRNGPVDAFGRFASV